MHVRPLFSVATLCLAALLPGLVRSALAEPAAAATAGGAGGAAAGATAPGTAVEPLTIEGFMARDWIGTPPEDPYWADDGRSIYYSQRRTGSDIVDLHRIVLGSGRSEVVAASELGKVDASGGSWSRDRSVKAFVREGDLFVRESSGRPSRQLTRTNEAESAPLVLADGDRVAFRRGDAFHAIDLASGLDSTLAELRLGKDPDAAPDREAFLAAEQLRLFAVLASRDERAEALKTESRARRAADPTRAPAPFYLGEGKEILRADLAPSGNRLLVVLGTPHPDEHTDTVGAEGGKEDAMPVFITESGYVETRPIRPKVGTGSPATPTVLLLDLARHTQVTLDLGALSGLADDPLAELRAAAAAAKASAAKTPATPSATAEIAKPEATATPAAEAKLRPIRVGDALWNEDGSRLALQLFSADNKDRWLVAVDPAAAPTSGASGAGGADAAAAASAGPPVVGVTRDSDPAWLGWRFTDFGWMKDGRTLWYLSESSGFSHLYLQAPGGARRALTQGPFEVDRPQLARDGKSFFLSANREAPGIYEAYRLRVDSPALEQLTASGGMTYALPSPDEKQLLLTSSWTTRPPELFVQAARAGAVPKALTTTVSPAFAAVAWSVPEIVAIRSTHFAGNLYARVYQPADAAAGATHPAVVFIHGAGYLQNAHQGWSDYYHEFMFHTLLARAGYVVLDLDYRASAGYGRDFRTAIYRQMGEPELEDLADGVAWLVAQRGVDAKRVGTYGGSYGGFLTMMALFKRPEIFAAGAALRPVTDWAHYNHGYTSAILNTPDVDPEAYRRSSPIEFAAGLSRPLLICHGMVDDNVAFQDSVRLVQRLIELGKSDLFETAIYPFEPHGFKEPTSWVDEYKRIFKLFEAHLK